MKILSEGSASSGAGGLHPSQDYLLMGAFMSAVTDEDRCGNRWMAKERSLNRIGPDVAPCTALGAAAAVSAPREPYILATIV